jgi:hypothetical protein
MVLFNSINERRRLLMPIASVISGLGALLGTGLAAAKVYRDDKQSKCPPPQMGPPMMCPYGYAPPRPPQQFVAPMMYPYGYLQPYVPNGYYGPPQYLPPPQPVSPQQQYDAARAYRKEMLKRLVVELVRQAVAEQIRQTGMGYNVPLPSPPPPVPQSVVSKSSKPLWDTPADGGSGASSPSYQLALVPKPMQMPPPPMPNPQQMYVTPQPPTVRFVQPEHLINESVVYTQSQQQPSSVYSTQQKQLSWSAPNAFNVDHQGFQSFVQHLDQKPKVPDNYVGNALDW